ncbi:MAG: hypothetical protein ACRD2M_10495 [Terriglobales bacterium]
MDEPHPPHTVSSPPESETPWAAIFGGGLLLLLVGGALAFYTRSETPAEPVAPAAVTPHAYGEKLQLTGLKMTEVENFVGGNVTYLEGNLLNGGDRTVAGVSVRVIFRNSLGEVAQRETLTVKVHQQVGTYTDVVDLKTAPLQPGESRGFRLTFDHVSADWNRVYPDLTVVGVAFQ